MRILVLGGTGSIGRAVVTELIARGHAVTGLARSPRSAAALERLGAAVLPGDIRSPGVWVKRLPSVHAVIHMATDFAADMGPVDTRLLDALLPALGESGRTRFVYTGGCWLYGATGRTAATEVSPFDAPQLFRWMIPGLHRVLTSDAVDGLAVHPALVYGGDGGVLAQFIEPARNGEPITIIGGTAVRWPLVHAEDLARLYALTVENGRVGRSYNGASIEGTPVGELAASIGRHYGVTDLRCISPEEAASRHGELARCYAISQSMAAARARRELGWRPRLADPLAVLPAQPVA